MSDLIDRRMAIKAIEDLPNCHNGYSDTYDKACIIGVLEQVPSAQPERKWIPCSEELPEKEGRYLCTVGSNHRNPREMIYAPDTSDTWRTADDNIWKNTDGTYCFNWFVEAWMPLPEPYKKGEQDE